MGFYYIRGHLGHWKDVENKVSNDIALNLPGFILISNTIVTYTLINDTLNSTRIVWHGKILEVQLIILLFK